MVFRKDDRTEEELLAWQGVLEACHGGPERVALDRDARNALTKVELQLHRLHAIQEAAINLARSDSKSLPTRTPRFTY